MQENCAGDIKFREARSSHHMVKLQLSFTVIWGFANKLVPGAECGKMFGRSLSDAGAGACYNDDLSLKSSGHL